MANGKWHIAKRGQAKSGRVKMAKGKGQMAKGGELTPGKMANGRWQMAKGDERGRSIRA